MQITEQTSGSHLKSKEPREEEEIDAAPTGSGRRMMQRDMGFGGGSERMYVVRGGKKGKRDGFGLDREPG